jgi:hypothetical protein
MTSNEASDKATNKANGYPTPDNASERQATVSNTSPPGILIQKENCAAATRKPCRGQASETIKTRQNRAAY